MRALVYDGFREFFGDFGSEEFIERRLPRGFECVEVRGYFPEFFGANAGDFPKTVEEYGVMHRKEKMENSLGVYRECPFVGKEPSMSCRSMAAGWAVVRNEKGHSAENPMPFAWFKIFAPLCGYLVTLSTLAM